jgi:hypothetical protein
LLLNVLFMYDDIYIYIYVYIYRVFDRP